MKFSVVLEDLSYEIPRINVLVENLETEQLPITGDYLILDIENQGQIKYLVIKVCRSFFKGKEYNTVSVLDA